MDPVQLATAAVEAMMPFLGKGLTEGGATVAEAFGKKSVEIGESIFKALWTRWKDKPEATDQLTKSVSDPATDHASLTMHLVADAASDKQFAESLEQLLQGQSSPEVFVRIVVKEAQDITGAQIREMIRAKLRINIDADKAGKIVGLVIDKLG